MPLIQIMITFHIAPFLHLWRKGLGGIEAAGECLESVHLKLHGLRNYEPKVENLNIPKIISKKYPKNLPLIES